MRRGSGALIYVVIFLVIAFGIVYVLRQSSQPSESYTYSEIMQYFDNYEVSKYSFDLGTGKLKMTVSPEGGEEKDIEYTVPNVNIFLDEIQSSEFGDNYREAYN
ncbi:MAG: ATP-dependent zinc metalloprotease FtsH, partial [Oscillospiraceae bacterium]|nr:ATP-dependent zinc metalloprotease FtsH [Oscillospiraceae bacterium]